MKKALGSAANINSEIIGRVTRKPINHFNRAKYILVTEEKNICNGYAAIITNMLEPPPTKVSLVYNIEDLSQFNEGDILLIEPNGNINIVYERYSNHNCLMITECCNCRCIMCPQLRLEKEHDKTALNMQIISLIDKKTNNLGLTGGEPTLMGDKLLNIISFCKEKLPKTSLTLLTNGIKFEDYSFVKSLSAIRHPNLFIDIPIYSDTDTEHNRIIGASGFYKTIKGIYNLALLNQKVGLRVVMHKMNYNRLPYLGEFIYRNFPFVFHIAFMQMETIGLARENIDKLWIDPFDYNKELQDAVILLAERDMDVSIYNAQLCVLSSFLRNYARKSISGWKNIYLDECSNCDFRNECGGFFESNIDMHSSHIKPLKKA